MATVRDRPLFTRFVQPGRLCLIRFGSDYNKLAIIVDIIDQNRVLIDGPTTGVRRQAIPLKRLALTDFAVKSILRGSRTKTVQKALEAHNVIEEFTNTNWGKKRAARMYKAQMNDFERFKLMRAQQKRQKLVKEIMKA